MGIRNISDLVKPIVVWKHWRPLKFKRKNFVLPVWLDKKSLHLKITILLKWTILIVATDIVSGPLSLEEGNSAWGLVLLWRWWQVRRQKIRDRSFFPLIQILLREKCWHNRTGHKEASKSHKRRAMQHDHIGKFDLSPHFEYDHHTLSNSI